MGRQNRNSSVIYCDVNDFVYYSHDRPEKCLPCPRCPKGRGMGSKAFQNIKRDKTHGALQCMYCVRCQDGYTYSDSSSYDSCKQCSNCKLYGMVEDKPCSRFQDAFCKKPEIMPGEVTTGLTLIKNNYIHHCDNGNVGSTIAVIVLTLVVIMLMGKDIYKYYKRYRKKKNRRHVGNIEIESIPSNDTTDEQDVMTLPQQECGCASAQYTSLKMSEVATSDDDYDYPADVQQYFKRESDDNEFEAKNKTEEEIIVSENTSDVSPWRLQRNMERQPSNDLLRRQNPDSKTVTDADIYSPIDVLELTDTKVYDVPLTMKQLRVAAKPLAGNNEHQKFSAFLGVEKEDLDVIITNNPSDVVEQSYQVLVKWQQIHGKHARKDKLFSALKQYKRLDVIQAIEDCK